MQAVRRDWLRVDVLVGGWLERWLLVRGFGEDQGVGDDRIFEFCGQHDDAWP